MRSSHQANGPQNVYWSALRWPAACLLMAAALIVWRIGMIGLDAEIVLEHVAFCLSGGAGQPSQAPTLFGHCAACYGAAVMAVMAVAAGAIVMWRQPRP
jgi:hypothetical protein